MATLKRDKELDAIVKNWGKTGFKALKLNDWSEPELESVIEYLSKFYYNDDPLVDDEIFDRIWNCLKQRNPKSKVFKKARAKVSNTRKKIKLACWMSSLDKVYPGGAYEKWTKKQNVDTYVVADKLDGFSIQVEYDSKGKKHIVSGGDGLYGQDLSHLNNCFDTLPDEGVRNVIVRCEGVMLKNRYNSLAEKFKSSRSALSNVFNNSNPDSRALRATHMIALELIKPSGLSLSKQYAKLKSLGFKVPVHRVVDAEDLNDSSLSGYYKHRKEKTKYAIDGIVVTADKTYTLPTRGNPSYAVAFKENSEDSMIEAEVIAVDGNISRTGRIVPKIQIKPVKINGVTVTKATGHNYGYIKNNKINVGSKILITRSGEVIPYIVRVLEPSKTWSKPKGKEGIDWYWDTDLDIKMIAHKQSDKDDMQIKALAYFASTLGIEGLKNGMASRLYFGGIETALDLVLDYSTKRFEDIGLGKTQSRILNENIDNVIGAGVELPLLATALSAFGVGIGYNKIKAIEESSTNLSKLKKLKGSKRENAISEIAGFSEITAKKISERLDSFFDWVEKSGINILESGKVALIDDVLSGTNIMFTGFRSTELEDWIKRHGGSIVSTVNSCNLLVVKDLKAKPSSKVTNALAKNIKIVSSNSFVNYYVNGTGSLEYYTL